MQRKHGTERSIRSSRAGSAITAALLLLLVMVSDASAQARSIDLACPEGQVPQAVYTDREGAHAKSIDCIVWWSLQLRARDGERFGTHGVVTRAEHAALLANLLDRTGYELAGSTADQGFEDVRGHPYERQINRLASLGVVRGKTTTRFDPSGSIQRDQMASLFVRLHDHVYEQTIEPGAGFSDTEGNVHEDNIRRLVAAGITAGKTSTTYDPHGTTTRGQMATFLMRYADLLVELDIADSPGRFSPVTRSGVGEATYELDVPRYAPSVVSCASGSGPDGSSIAAIQLRGDNGGAVDNRFSLACPDEGATYLANFWRKTETPTRVLAGVEVQAPLDREWTLTVRSVLDVPVVGLGGRSGFNSAVLDVSALDGRSVRITSSDSIQHVYSYDTYAVVNGSPACCSPAKTVSFRIPDRTRWIELSATGAWHLEVL